MLKTYAYHKPTEPAKELMHDLREAYSRFHQTLVDTIPASRELSLALTSLEQSAMWTMKAVSHADATQAEEASRKPSCEPSKTTEASNREANGK